MNETIKLKKIKVSEKISNEEFKEKIKKYEIELNKIQRDLIDKGTPVIIIFEGWDAAGKGSLINRLMGAFDPRGFNVYPINKENEEERHRPFLWRFWTKTPEKGRISIFDRSWYGKVSLEKVEKKISKKEYRQSLREIKQFEKILCDSGVVIIKFFLHISKKTQDKRFEKLLSNKSTAWKVKDEDLRRNKKYKKYLKQYNEMIDLTNYEFSDWNIIYTNNLKTGVIKTFETCIKKLKNVISTKKTELQLDKQKEKFNIDLIDLNKEIMESFYKEKLNKLQKKLRELEHEIFIKRIPIIILYEGWDAAGKGGNIKRVVKKMDPRGFEVIPIAAPTIEEKSHHYLWRFWKKIPKAGHIAIFDRTWYGRVLVERVEKFCKDQEWKRAYSEINDFEKQLVNSGALVFKFFIHIDKAEQLKRFKSRENISYKRYKITKEDYRNREKWNEYESAINDMVTYTSTKTSKWNIIEGNSKYYARIKVMEILVREIEKKLKEKGKK